MLKKKTKQSRKQAKRASTAKGGSSWRTDAKHFSSGTPSPEGWINISPAWFQQAHDVGVSACKYLIYRQLISNDKTVQECPQAGAPFKLQSASDWLDSLSESNSILTAILAVIHPSLYDAGRETFDRLRKAPGIERQDVLSRWTSVFNGVSVLSNRRTPAHRDGNSAHHWYDMLVTLGSYTNCNLELPGAGVSLEYGPGTVVGFAGMTLEHGVPSFTGERLCYAYFMRDNVHEWARVSGRTWMNTSYYK
jgi:hypothetical protein